jgi:hypothetical protein
VRNTVVLAILANGLLSAQDIAGDWQAFSNKGRANIGFSSAKMQADTVRLFRAFFAAGFF